MRDVVLSRVPAILDREIYASVELLGAAVQVGASYVGLTAWWMPWFATVLCVTVRLASLYLGWRLPIFRSRRADAFRNNE